MILVVTSADDRHTDIVGRELDTIGAEWVRFNTEEFPENARLDAELRGGELRGALHLGGQRVDLSAISAVWYRRPEPPRISATVTDPEAREIAEAESRSTLRGLWAALYDRFWVSWPMHIRRADQKLLQLRLAAELGFSLPPTLITQSAERARRFYSEMGGSALVKTVSGVFIEGPPHRAVYTNKLTEDDLARLDRVAICPTQFQWYVPKAAELRVTVVGRSRLFAAEMDTQANSRTAIDWRRGSPMLVPHRLVTLPPRVGSRCLALVRRLDLQFGAIDLIRSRRGEYYFLEINPNGQFAWIEGLTGAPISRALAELLRQGDNYKTVNRPLF